MKILKIRLLNIHSLKGSHELSFTDGPLSKTGLFAITGPTGSGKSTLLDVITLALFNQTPRTGSLSKSAIERLGAVITRNTDEAFAEIEYEARSRVFRSKWEISRARTGNLRDYNMFLSAMNVEGDFEFFDIKKGDVPDKNAEIIGLNYEQFVKSILLSQGEFARFLKADSKERSELLEKITGTEIYRAIGKAAYEKHKEEKQKLEQLEQKLKDIKMLTADEIVALNMQLDELNQESLETSNAREVCGTGIKIKKDLKLKTDALLKLNEHLDILALDEEKLAPEKNRLKLHQLVLPLKSDLDNLNALQMRKIKTENEAKSLKLLAIELTDKLENLKNSLAAKMLEKENVKTLLTAQKPLFTEIIKYDKEIEISATRKKELNQRLGLMNLDEKNEVQKLDEERKTLEAIDEKLRNIKKFTNENHLLENIGDTLPGMTENYRQLNDSLQTFNESLKKEFPDLFNEMLQNHTASSKQELLNQIIEDYEASLQELNLNISGEANDKLTVQQKIRETDEKIRVYEELIRHSEIHQKLKIRQDSDEQKLQKVKTSFELAVKEEQQAVQKLEIIEKYIEELKARNEREALEAKYEDARALLKPGEACPLCGSTSHPLVGTYVSKLSSTKLLLLQTTEEQKGQRLLKDRYLREKAAFEAQLKAVTENIEKSKDSIAETLAIFEKFGNDAKLTNLTINDKSALLGSRDKLAGSLSKLKAIIEVIEKISQIETSLKGLRYFYTSLGQLLKLDEAIKGGLQKFQKYLNNVSDTGDCLRELGRQQGFYKKAIEQNQSFRENKSTIGATIAEKEKGIQKLQKDIQDLSASLANESGILSKLIAVRKEKFGEKDPVQEEKNTENQLRKLEKEEFEIKNNITKTTGELQSTQQTTVKSDAEMSVTASEILKIREYIDPELKKLGFHSPEAADEAILQSHEAEMMGKKLNDLKDEITKTKQSLVNLSEDIEKLSSVDDQRIDIEMLETTYADLTKKVNRLNQEIGAKMKILEQNDANLGRTVEIRLEKEQQENEFAGWDALNRLIGDAAGKKFSGFAQELTLRYMLIKANYHLKSLTDRYCVTYTKTETIDELFVTDTYHGDENRSVKTLSGGESFQVSLALALGLSDLAGNKTRIESLFIDEGFGTLDQETLDTALSALEKLQDETNRTIGIISHVDALKERITTQIELLKDASGNSRLVVRG